MKLRRLGPLVLSLLAVAGCNGGIKTKKPAVRRDPAFEQALKRLEEPRGFKHTVKKGETLYALGRKYGVPVAAIIAANPGLNPKDIKIGAKVAIPGVAAPGTGTPKHTTPTGPVPAGARTPDRGRLRYPVSSKYRATGSVVPGAEFPVKSGTSVLAAERGKVVVATADLGGLGPTVMVDHGKGLVTLYGRLADYAVRPGQSLKRGQPLGRAGATGLLFRVYQGAVPKRPGPYIK